MQIENTFRLLTVLGAFLISTHAAFAIPPQPTMIGIKEPSNINLEQTSQDEAGLVRIDVGSDGKARGCSLISVDDSKDEAAFCSVAMQSSFLPVQDEKGIPKGGVWEGWLRAVIPAAGVPGASHSTNAQPPSAYPEKALREGRQGLSGLKVLIGTTGLVLACEIIRSSGHQDLDEAACKTPLKSRRSLFKPARDKMGTPIQSSQKTAVNWKISDGTTPETRWLGQVAITFPANATETEKTDLISKFSKAIQASRGCAQASQVARDFGGTFVERKHVRLKDLPSELVDHVENLKVGESTPLFGNRQDGARALFYCGPGSGSYPGNSGDKQ